MIATDDGLPPFYQASCGVLDSIFSLSPHKDPSDGEKVETQGVSHVPQPAKGCDLTLGCVPPGPLVLRMKERHQIVHSHDPEY